MELSDRDAHTRKRRRETERELLKKSPEEEVWRVFSVRSNTSSPTQPLQELNPEPRCALLLASGASTRRGPVGSFFGFCASNFLDKLRARSAKTSQEGNARREGVGGGEGGVGR